MTNSDRPLMIFHAPYPLDPDATSASGLRPVHMQEAFESIGYRVVTVTGTHDERRRRINQVRARIDKGLSVKFVYSEASTQPMGLGQPASFAMSFHRDMAFLKYCRDRKIPVGLYYRDVYWRFPNYADLVSQPQRAFRRWRYRADLRGYRHSVDRLYLPSLRMAPYLPEANRTQALALPPGGTPLDTPRPKAGPISLVYVGGISSYYRMHEALRGVELAQDARLTLCTRKSEWTTFSPSYDAVKGEATNVVHCSGGQLAKLYAQAHLGLLLMEPINYREFAVPFKLFEYLGRGKPVVATRGTLAGDFVSENGVGWAIPYRGESLAELLNLLAANPAELDAMQDRVERLRTDHSWEARARQVAEDLTL